MAADQDRAERIGDLKKQRPDLTWRVIADRVDVSERAAIAWAQSGGIEYDNAKKLAAVFEVDVDYIMRGRPEETPDPFAAAPPIDLADRLDRLEDKLDAIIAHLEIPMPAQTPLKEAAQAAQRVAERRRARTDRRSADQEDQDDRATGG